MGAVQESTVVKTSLILTKTLFKSSYSFRRSM